MPRLSVIMPVRDGESSVGLAVRSTLRALPRDAELVVHDDASRDRTPEVLAQVRDRRLRVLRSEQGRGVAGGLNHLLDNVDSEVVARMDADDVCFPWRFALQDRAWRAAADVVFCTVVYFGPTRSRIRPMSPVPISPQAFPLHLLLANPVSHSAMYGSLARVRAVGGYRAMPAEDYDLWLRLATDGARLARLAVAGVGYRIHAGQVTASSEWRAQAAGDQLIVEAYTRLASSYLDVPVDWYGELRAARRGVLPDSARAPLERLTRSLERASRQLSRRERLFLMSKCAKITRGNGLRGTPRPRG